ncbi:GNAT family N-acetyltransferase [Altericroceibacterium endophyticum]|uniref:GNAT family N-acetyltransferase n=1 Tax=Altericroceibacterium endophyticum TaxID=1808508 RepID=A0A6I4T6B9_9SPHN|nr:GNAT family N-acetyltransferase [Altericroceibacterium endophyticum]MXO65671.1 GNAT family N-acetyltransferase [Altericroceibacterium endophyticum]
MAEFRLETERLILRDWREEDWEPFFQHTDTPAVMRWLGGVLEGGSNRMTRPAVKERLEGYARDFGFTFWVVERKPDGGHLAGEILGFCGLKRANQPGGPQGDMEIGWRFREDSWGRGYAREAAEACMEAGFEQFGAPHMIALTVMGNKGSWGLMKRLGMRRREDLDFASDDFGDEGPIIVYSITRAEWETQAL